jgi:DNA primase catalytic core
MQRQRAAFLTPLAQGLVYGQSQSGNSCAHRDGARLRRRLRAPVQSCAREAARGPDLPGRPARARLSDSVPNESVYERVIATVPLSVAFREFLGEDALRPASEAGNYKVVCPFHDDKNPSLSLSDSKKVWNCFGCGASGNLFGLEKRRFGLNTAAEALQSLAARYPEVKRIMGARTRPYLKNQVKEEIEFPPLQEASLVPRPPQSRQWGASRARRILTSAILNAANEYFVENLREATHVQDYIMSRGLSPSTVASFGFGYAPDTPSMSGCLVYLRQRGFDAEACVDAGVAKRGSDGEVVYDVFRDRVTIPIRNTIGEIESFAGRLLKESDTAPKYVNGTNSPVFKKRESLFGIDLAEEAESARKEYGIVVLVEGYMDVAVLHEKSKGSVSCVASMGTAVSTEQIRAALSLLKDRVDGKLIVNLDGDSAGFTAAERLCESVLPAISDVSCVHLGHPPAPYKDAGDFFENIENSVEGYIEHLESTAKHWIEWRVRRIIEPVLAERELERTEAEVELVAELGARSSGEDLAASPDDEVNAAGASFSARQSEVLYQGSRSLLQGMSGFPAETGSKVIKTSLKPPKRASRNDEQRVSEDDATIAGCPMSVLDQLGVFVSKALKVSPGTNIGWLVHGWANALCDGNSKNIPILYDAMMKRIDSSSAGWAETSPAQMIDFMPPPPWVIEELPKRSQNKTRARAGMNDEGATMGIAAFFANKKLMQESKQRREFQEQYIIPRIAQSKSIASREFRSNPRAAAEEIILRSLIWAEEEVRIEALDELLKIMIRMEETGLFPFWTVKPRAALFEYLLAVTGDLSVEEMAAECESEPWWEYSLELLFVPSQEFDDDELLCVRDIELSQPVMTVRRTACAIEEMAQKVAAAKAVDRLPEFLKRNVGQGVVRTDKSQEDARVDMNEAISGRQFLTGDERNDYEAHKRSLVEDARRQLELQEIESRLLRGEQIELDSPNSKGSGDYIE